MVARTLPRSRICISRIFLDRIQPARSKKMIIKDYFSPFLSSNTKSSFPLCNFLHPFASNDFNKTLQRIYANQANEHLNNHQKGI